MGSNVFDFEWKQTKTHLCINVPLKNIPSSNVNIFTSKNYIKAKYAPYIFEVFLLHPIVESTSKATITQEKIIFELEKEEAELWETLQKEQDKKDLINLRQKITQEGIEKCQTLRKERLEAKSNRKKMAKQAQISLMKEEQNFITETKEKEKLLISKDLLDWNKAMSGIEKPNGKNLEAKVEQNEEDIEKEKLVKNIRPVPLPRKFGVITFKFTPREFPTPARATKAAEENQWLKKMAENIKSAGFSMEDLPKEKQDPLLVEKEGDKFFKEKNYMAALGAYTSAIKLSSPNFDLYIKRAETHLNLKNLHKTIEDSTKALDLLRESSNDTSKQASAHRIRGLALCQLGQDKYGKIELDASVEMK